MSERIVTDPSQHGWVEVNGKWMWGASDGSGDSYDDTEVRGLISANTTAISGLDSRVTALESAGGGGDAYTKAESDAKYVPKSGNTTIAGKITATDLQATG